MSEHKVEEEIVLNGRKVTPGTELSIHGERGRFRFVRQVTTPTSMWVDVIGPAKVDQWRSFTLDRIKTVHRIDETPRNLLRKRREARSSA